MFCPKCKAEYRESFKICVDCNVPLVDKLPEEKKDYKPERKLVSIYRYSNIPESHRIKALLEEEKIPCELHSFENWGYDGAFRGQMGMGEIIVPDEYADKAKGIIDKFSGDLM